MKAEKIMDYAAIGLVFVGFAFAFLAHATHPIIGEEDNIYEHYIHIFGGMSIVLLGIIMMVYRQNGFFGVAKDRYYNAVQKAVITE